MKVLYADPMSFGHHAHYNRNNIRILGKLCELSVYFKSGYMDYSDLPVNRIYESKLSLFPNDIEHKNKVYYFYKVKTGQIKILKDILRIATKDKYDLIVFSCVDIASFSIATKTSNLNIAFIDHGIFSTVDQKWLRFFWRIINPRLKVCLLEEYFMPYVRKTLHCKNDLYILPHPISQFSTDNSFINLGSNAKRKNIIFAPSNSNSQKYIDELIAKSKLIPNTVKIIIKGHVDYSSEELEIYTGSLDRNVYNSYFSCSSYILIPYDCNYNYRTSGVIFDAMICKKKVLLIEGNTLEEYKTKYKRLFIGLKDVKDLLNYLSNTDNFEKNDDKDIEEFNRFIDNYSDSAIEDGFNRLLENVPLV